MNYILFSLLFIFGYLSHSNIQYGGELTFLELFQLIILAICIFVHLSCKKLFLSLSNLFIFIIRLFLFLFLFYEEISFLTKDSIELFQSINRSSELNLHNSYIMDTILFRVPIPFTSHISSITLVIFVISIVLLIFAFGSFLPYLKRFRYLFLERKFSIFSLVYLLNISLTAVIREFFNPSLIRLIGNEYVELYIYILLLFDVVQKKKMMNKKCNKNEI